MRERQHDIARMLWEWWRVENFDGFQNPELAREALGRFIAAARKSIDLLEAAGKEPYPDP